MARRMAWRAIVVICSSSAVIAAIWSSFSRVISSSGKVAWTSTSDKMSMPSRRSGFITSTETLKLLFPESARICPPTASISSLSCSPSRRAVPLIRVRAARAVTPLVPAVSARRPPRKTETKLTSGSLRSSQTSTRSPLGRVKRSIRRTPGAAAVLTVRSREPLGLSEVMVAFDSTRYWQATRCRSAASTRPTCPRYSEPRSGLRASNQLPPMSEARPRAVERLLIWSARMLFRALVTSLPAAACPR